MSLAETIAAAAAKCALEGHRYEPRYDEVTNVDATSSANFWRHEGTARIVDRIYVADVCIKCGHIIHRERK